MYNKIAIAFDDENILMLLGNVTTTLIIASLEGPVTYFTMDQLTKFVCE